MQRVGWSAWVGTVRWGRVFELGVSMRGRARSQQAVDFGKTVTES
jgi:hypothetical protein